VKRQLVVRLGLAAASLGGARLPAQQAEPVRKWGVGAGVGITVPTGAYASTDHPGGNALMYFSYSPLPAFAVGLDVGVTRTPRKTSGHTDLTEVLVGGVWRARPRAASPRPFLLGSVGVVAVDTDNPDKGRLAFGGGAGVSIGRGDARLFVEARFLRVQASGGALSLVPITVGFATLAP
jgi:hypothetical protein